MSGRHKHHLSCVLLRQNGYYAFSENKNVSLTHFDSSDTNITSNSTCSIFQLLSSFPELEWISINIVWYMSIHSPYCIKPAVEYNLHNLSYSLTPGDHLNLQTIVSYLEELEPAFFFF